MAFSSKRVAPNFHRPSPRISIFVEAPDSSQYKLEQTLLDSRASFNTISRRVINALGLQPTLLSNPFSASAAGNNDSVHTHHIAVNVTISGVVEQIFCYVDEKDHHFNFLIGMPGLAQFRMHMEFAAGPCNETMVAMKRDLAGGGFEHVVLECQTACRPFGELGIVKVVSAEQRAEVKDRGESVAEWKRRKQAEVEKYAGMLSGMMPGFLRAV